MQIPKYYEIDEETFKVEFDNSKKVHVAVNKKTGEKTNISVLGVLMQMGILKPGNDSDITSVKLDSISKRLENIESKVGVKPTGVKKETTLKDVIEKKPEKKLVKEVEYLEKMKPEKKEEPKPEKKEKPIEIPVDEHEELPTETREKPTQKDILDEIEEETDRVLSKDQGIQQPTKKSTGKDIKKEIMESVLEKTVNENKKENQPPDVKKESEEEIDNWMEI